MHDRLDDIESRLDSIERRLARLEGASPAAPAPDARAPQPSLDNSLLTDLSGHVGRVLLIFGGAYLLRAITDFNFVPTAIGILMGAGYALFWLYMAWRKSARHEHRAIATFYGGTSTLLALPLVVEAVSHFGILSGIEGVAALAVFTALALAVAALRRLRILAWLVTAGGVLTGFAILIVAHSAVAAAAFLLLLGLASLWLAYARDVRGPQWLGAVGANAGVGAVIVFVNSEQWTIEPAVGAVLAGLLLVFYLASFALYTHRLGASAGIFEIVQSPLVAVVGAAAAASGGPSAVALGGAVSIALGAGAYILAFAPGTRTTHGPNFYFYTLLGLVLVAAGSALLLEPVAAAAVWSVLAIALAFASGRTGWVILSLECTVLLLAAGIGSGLIAAGLHAFVGAAGASWPVPEPAHVAIALATVICLFVPVAQRSERWGALAGVPQLTVLALSVWEVGGLIVLYLAPTLAGNDAGEVDAGLLAAIRTAVLSAAAATLALSSCHRRWPEARWLVYPVLVLAGLKLFIEDFPNGRPATLFIALAFIGGALVFVAKVFARRPTEQAG